MAKPFFAFKVVSQGVLSPALTPSQDVLANGRLSVIHFYNGG
jgi:hypothetical protein